MAAFAYGRDSTPIHYNLEGRGQLAVLCDGIGCYGYMWKHLGPQLASRFAVLTWHYRGHGQTPAPRDPERVSITDLADDLEVILDACDSDEPVLMFGHSMGVQVCLEAYRRYRHRIGGLVLLCGSYGNPLRTFKGTKTLDHVLPAVRSLVARTPNLARYLIRATLPTDLSYEIAAKLEINAELIRKEDFFPYLYGISHIDPNLFLDMLAYAGRHSAGEILDQITVPALVIAGDRDGFTPPWLSHEMADRIPNAELVVIEGGSHTAPLERPDIVAEAVDRFLARAAALPLDTRTRQG